MLFRNWRLHLAAVAAYSALTLAYAWPLPLHLSTHLTGDISGDTGVYVWNQWLFRQELVARRSFPLYTSEIFSATGQADLSLHNYTIFADLLAFPLIPWLGVVATFNLVFFFLTLLTAWTTFVLVRHVTGHAAASWLAGALFAWSPVLVARSNAHFSLLGAAPLAVFLWCLLRTGETCKARFAVGAGATTAWAVTCDAYYGVYCVVIAVVFLANQLVRLQFAPSGEGGPARAVAGRVLDASVLALVAMVSFLAISGGAEWSFGSARISIRTLYTPMLLLTLMLAGKVALRSRARVVFGPRFARVPGLFGAAVVTCVILLSPVLVALAVRAVEGGLASPPIFWRSSPRGVDLLALVLPNPNHPLFGASFRAWLTTLPSGYVENAASLPLTAIAFLAVAWWKGWAGRRSRLWIWLAVSFGSIALGPFVHVAGQNIYVATPWTFLRFVPVLSAARTPARFSIVLTLAVAVLFGIALARACTGRSRRTRVVLASVGILLLFELLPAPRRLHAATTPEIYDIVAADPDDVALLELPFGIRDGTSSLGDFFPGSQFYQTRHGKRLVGGYLSRVSPKRMATARAIPVLEGLMLADAGVLPTSRQRVKYVESGKRLVERSRIRYVVVDRERATQASERLAVEAFGLTDVSGSGTRTLYRTGTWTTADPWRLKPPAESPR